MQIFSNLKLHTGEKLQGVVAKLQYNLCIEPIT